MEGGICYYHEITPEGRLEENGLWTDNLAVISPSLVAADDCHVAVLLRLQQTIAALMAKLSHTWSAYLPNLRASSSAAYIVSTPINDIVSEGCPGRRRKSCTAKKEDDRRL